MLKVMNVIKEIINMYFVIFSLSNLMPFMAPTNK